MQHRRKILIIESDDFLREILGNLLHKNKAYIINGFCIENGIKEAKGKTINTVILGTSCADCENKKPINYIKKNLGPVEFFILNDTNKEIDFIPKDMQMKMSELSIEKIIKKLS